MAVASGIKPSPQVQHNLSENRYLSHSGIRADAIHSNKSQNARHRLLHGFRHRLPNPGHPPVGSPQTIICSFPRVTAGVVTTRRLGRGVDFRVGE
jgi:hypothetical protein